MTEFQLFRVHVDYPTQTNLFASDELLHTKIFKNIITESLEYTSRRRKEWHIGNITQIDKNSYYFRIGKITKSTLEFFREGNFIDNEFDISPYTHVFFDIKIELLAIAKKNSTCTNREGHI